MRPRRGLASHRGRPAPAGAPALAELSTASDSGHACMSGSASSAGGTASASVALVGSVVSDGGVADRWFGDGEDPSALRGDAGARFEHVPCDRAVDQAKRPEGAGRVQASVPDATALIHSAGSIAGGDVARHCGVTEHERRAVQVTDAGALEGDRSRGGRCSELVAADVAVRDRGCEGSVPDAECRRTSPRRCRPVPWR